MDLLIVILTLAVGWWLYAAAAAAPRNPSRISAAGLAFLAKHEGFRAYPYRDQAGVLTVGYGHVLTPKEKKTRYINTGARRIAFSPLDRGDAFLVLCADLRRFESVVTREVTVFLPQHRYDALVSFAFNVGTQAFRSSSLLKFVNRNQAQRVPEQLKRWVHVRGRVSRGLVGRRKNEARLWTHGKYGLTITY